MNRHYISYATFLSALLCGSLQAQPLSSVRVGSGFTQPLFATSAPGDPGNLYVVQKGGQILTFNPSSGVTTGTFLDLTTVAGANLQAGGNEQGLLGMAFHPDYSGATGNGFVFVNYTSGAAGSTRIDRFQVLGGAVQTATRQTMLTFAQPFSNHNGGWIGFNPTVTGADRGFLYIASGDGGSSNDPGLRAQNTNVVLGKMLRIDVLNTASATYTIPATNPYAISGGAPEVYHYGLRNPWRNSFDRANGNMYIADVGQNNWEEINFVAAGTSNLNFGWRDFEGNHVNPSLGGSPSTTGRTFPIHEYDHTGGRISITGGYVYRGPGLLDGGTSLDGTYFFSDIGSGSIYSFRYNGTTLSNLTDRTSQLGTAPGGFVAGNLSSFAEDGFGNLYMIDYGGTFGSLTGLGEIYRITGTPVPEPTSLFLLCGAASGAGWLWRRRRLAVAQSASV